VGSRDRDSAKLTDEERRALPDSPRTRDPKTVERTAARVVIIDAHRRVLLLKTRSLESAAPSTWALPGGAVESGESPSDAALRELVEETGITALDIGESFAELESEFFFSGVHYRQRDLIFGMALGQSSMEMLGEGDEPRDGLRWWHLTDLVLARVPMFPVTLPDFVVSFVTRAERGTGLVHGVD
jgi:8-oxo-dGTP pyrophosphatase MutT (NUDIX family)